MRNRTILTLEDARQMLAAAEARALQLKLPVAIVIADEAGEPLALTRLEGARGLTAELAIRKARCAATSQRTTAFWMERMGENPAFASIPYMCALAGGVPIEHAGHCLGAIGVSGAAAPGEDDLIAAAGIAALPLK
ncbi:MAG: heme-binding protein [Steroidobacteraceae bacterium]